MECYICPRKCGADRNNESGFCGCDNDIKICRASPHHWEEPCLSGKAGSGTVFFSGCQLHCIYCQNHKISHGDIGKTVSQSELYDVFFKLKNMGVHNINLVTPDMYIPQIIPVIKKAKKDGIEIPFIMNCSGYETEEMINSLKDIIDIYLPDFKYMSPLLSQKYSYAKDYSEIAKKAIESMVKQQDKCIFDSYGMMQKGVIVRHMMLPGKLHDSKKILSYLYETYGDNIYISIMSQYTPVGKSKYEELNKKITGEEYNSLVEFAISLGIKNSYIQEGEAANESFIPNFSCEF